MMKWLMSWGCVGISCLVPLLHAQETASVDKEESMIIHSGEAEYDGKEMTLVGQVVVQHGLGQISAHRLSILPSVDKDKKNKFGLLKMGDDVQIELTGGGKLECQQAEVNYAKMQGIFLGNTQKPDVIYSNKGEGKDSSQKNRPPLEVKSLCMILDLIREPVTSSSANKTFVQQIEADQDVRVHYNQDYLFLADHAVYQRLPTTSTSPASKAGLLTLSVKEHPVCQMTNLNGDRLCAQRIRVNTVERQLSLEEPKGTLYTHREKPPVQTLEFTANQLVWNDQQQTLELKGAVNITQNETVKLYTDDELSISQAVVNGKRVLRSIQAPKNVQITYLDIQKGYTHKMNCPGPLTIDHEQQEMFLQGLPARIEQGEEGQQVYIEDLLGEMYADRIQINYKWEDRQLVPEKVVLQGHVRLVNRFDGHVEESSSILHYALADRVDYFPNQHEMVLAGDSGNRVLFFDKVNNVQMSAPSLKLRHDVTTQKNSIQGLGDVRFTFIEKELQQIKQRFRLAETAAQEELENDSSKK